MSVSMSVCLCVCVQVAEMLLELCVTELEDVAADRQAVSAVAQPVIQESAHPYTDDMTISGTACIPGISLTLSLPSSFLNNTSHVLLWLLVHTCTLTPVLTVGV